MEIKITTANFEQEVLNADKPVLVDFWATWCGPCKMIAPIIEEIANENTQIKVGKVNVDEEMALAQQFKVVSIPTLLIFKDKKVVGQIVGFTEKENILKAVEDAIK